VHVIITSLFVHWSDQCSFRLCKIAFSWSAYCKTVEYLVKSGHIRKLPRLRKTHCDLHVKNCCKVYLDGIVCQLLKMMHNNIGVIQTLGMGLTHCTENKNQQICIMQTDKFS